MELSNWVEQRGSADSHYRWRSDLAAISAFEPIQAFGEHLVTVSGDGKHFKAHRSDARSLLKRINERNRFIDPGSGGHTFIDPNRAGREPTPYGNPTAIFRISSKKSGDTLNWCWH